MDPIMLFYKVLILFLGCPRIWFHAWLFKNHSTGSSRTNVMHKFCKHRFYVFIILDTMLYTI